MNLIRTRRFDRDYQRLSQNIQSRVDEKLRLLSSDITRPSLRVKKLSGMSDIYEASITMNYRLLFQITPDGYLLLRVGTHTEILGR